MLSSNSRLRIVVTGLIAQHPSLGGVAWDYVQYVVGLHRMGHDVYYLEDSGEWPYTIDGGPTGDAWIAYDCRANVDHLAAVMQRFGLSDRWAYRFPIKPKWYGMPHATRREVLRTADLLLNVSGTLKRPSDYREIGRLAYIDSDPVFTQIKLTLDRGFLKFRKRVAAHDVHFTFGERLSLAVPPTSYTWLPTRQPIVLSEWRRSREYRDAYTTVMSWTSYKPLRYDGRAYAQKDAEFMRFLSLPASVAPTQLEVAVSGTSHINWQTAPAVEMEAADTAAKRDTTTRALLTRHGWQVADPALVSGTLDAYRSYVESSKGEWSVAKNGYVAGQAGWFSCRSACYLAAGRPVIVQDTGFGSVLPVGTGILTFTTKADAAAAIKAVEGDYRRHADAAVEIAREYFDSRTVLRRLIERAMNEKVVGAA